MSERLRHNNVFVSRSVTSGDNGSEMEQLNRLKGGIYG